MHVYSWSNLRRTPPPLGIPPSFHRWHWCDMRMHRSYSICAVTLKRFNSLEKFYLSLQSDFDECMCASYIGRSVYDEFLLHNNVMLYASRCSHHRCGMCVRQLIRIHVSIRWWVRSAPTTCVNQHYLIYCIRQRTYARTTHHRFYSRLVFYIFSSSLLLLFFIFFAFMRRSSFALLLLLLRMLWLWLLLLPTETEHRRQKVLDVSIYVYVESEGWRVGVGGRLAQQMLLPSL